MKRFKTPLLFTHGTLTEEMAVFCDHFPLKNARASYPISL
jgi:hypothetical protein